MKKIYKATKGSPFGKKQAQVYGECLDRITEKYNGTLKPEFVVEEAKSNNSPLHNYFDWDSKSASQKWRLFQARNLINHIVVIVKYDNKKSEQKAFFSINKNPDEEEKNKVYVTFERALSEPDLRKQVLKQAIAEAIYWEDKYKEYQELDKVFRAIEITRKRVIK